MKHNKGFTLIELLVAIAIIAVLASIVLASLSSGKNKGNDSKVQSQLKSAVSQSQLFTGTTGTAYIITTPYTGAITGATAGGTAATGTLFNDTTVSNNGIYRLISTLPSGTIMYYGWDGVAPVSGGKWFFAASLSTGAYCVDSSGLAKASTGAVTTTVASFTADFPSATVVGLYSCN